MKTKKNTTAVIYARVSTNGQDYDRQLNDLREYASRMGYVVIKEFAEKISGAKKVAEREALTELLSFVEANHIDKVLIYECSRLSRRGSRWVCSSPTSPCFWCSCSRFAKRKPRRRNPPRTAIGNDRTAASQRIAHVIVKEGSYGKSVR